MNANGEFAIFETLAIAIYASGNTERYAWAMVSPSTRDSYRKQAQAMIEEVKEFNSDPKRR